MYSVQLKSHNLKPDSQCIQFSTEKSTFRQIWVYTPSAISNISCRVVRVNIVVEKSSVILLCFSHIRLNPLSNKTRNLSRISSNACFRIWIADYWWDDSTLFIIIASRTHICWNFLVRQVIYSWRWKAYKQTLVGEGKAIENVKRSWNYRWTWWWWRYFQTISDCPL